MDSSQPKVYGGEISVGLEPESFPVGFSTNIYPVAQCSILDLCLEMDSSQPKIYGEILVCILKLTFIQQTTILFFSRVLWFYCLCQMEGDVSSSGASSSCATSRCATSHGDSPPGDSPPGDSSPGASPAKFY